MQEYCDSFCRQAAKDSCHFRPPSTKLCFAVICCIIWYLKLYKLETFFHEFTVTPSRMRLILWAKNRQRYLNLPYWLPILIQRPISKQAQQLQMPITSASKLASTLCNDVVFLILKACISETGSQNAEFTQLGFIRFGARDLYCSDGNCLQHLPNCQSILGMLFK